MGAVKDLMMRYCETVHPDDWDKQDDLFDQIIEGKVEGLDMEGMIQAVKEFEESGKVPTQPAVTLDRVTDELKIVLNPRMNGFM